MYKENLIVINHRKVKDERTPDPGFQEADIFFSPIDILVHKLKGGDQQEVQLLGKVGYSDNRNDQAYGSELVGLVSLAPKGVLYLRTITIDEADEMGLINKPVAIQFSNEPIH